MADKIIIDEKIVEEIIDITKIIVPEGYLIVEDPAVKIAELKQIEIDDLQKIINEPIPNDADLIEMGKLYHPYFEAIRRLEDL